MTQRVPIRQQPCPGTRSVGASAVCRPIDASSAPCVQELLSSMEDARALNVGLATRVTNGTMLEPQLAGDLR